MIPSPVLRPCPPKTRIPASLSSLEAPFAPLLGALLAPLLLLQTPAASGAPTLKVYPETVKLAAPGQSHGLLGVLEESGSTIAFPSDLRFESEHPNLVTVSPTGVVTASQPGQTRILVSQGTSRVAVPVHVGPQPEPEPWDFKRHILPILSKANCNGGGCHGALAGKGGFRLSLSAYDPESDFLNITRDALGRRIESSDPVRSLLLTKPTGATPHKGGRRLHPQSDDYRILAEWIAAGASGPSPKDAKLDHLEIFPKRWSLRKGDRLRFLVLAHYSDGRIEEVTRWAKFTATDETLLRLTDANGNAEVIGHGEGAVTAWFSSRIVMARVLSPFPGELPKARPEIWAENNRIDTAINAQLRQLRLEPSPQADDATFLRRAFLDTLGVLPTPEEIRAFLDNPKPDKRQTLIEQLLQRPEFIDYWTYRWADLLLVSGEHLRPEAVKAYYLWIRAQVESSQPWDRMVQAIVTSRGSSFEHGATNFFAVHQEPEAMAENVSQAFMGLSINCAKCHNHPLEKWTNDQYYSFANLFSRVRAKGWGGDTRNGDGLRTLYTVPSGELIQPRTGRPQPAAPLDAAPLPEDQPDSDRRATLAQWLTSPQNPYFTRAIVNRVWANFFGIGIVNPVDDLRASNPATNDPLMQSLCDFLIEQKYDLKALMRLILQSATYQRSSTPSPANRADSRYFARYYPRRLMAEVLSDAISAATGLPESFTETLNADGSAEKTTFYPKGFRALQTYDSAVKSYFLKTFGRNQRAITCDCERSNQPSIVQALHLSNGTTLNDKLASKDSFLTALLQSPDSDSQRLDTLFLRCLGRPPKTAESERFLVLLGQTPTPERRAAFEDLAWSLLTSREFLFQH
jgi:hypothetical protein